MDPIGHSKVKASKESILTAHFFIYFVITKAFI